MRSWTKNNTLKPAVPNHNGIYRFYDKNKRILYVGHAKNLRHRIQSYRQVDDFQAHPTKANLRPKIRYYDYELMPVQHARRVEKAIKKRTPYNYK